MVNYTFSGIKRVLSHDEFGAVVEVDAGGEAPRGLGAGGVLHHRAAEEVINRAFVGEGRFCAVAGLCLLDCRRGAEGAHQRSAGHHVLLAVVIEKCFFLYLNCLMTLIFREIMSMERSREVSFFRCVSRVLFVFRMCQDDGE